MPAPLVSVVIPTHNRAHFVGDAIVSIQRQTLSDLEIIVVDDGSTDGTTDLIERLDEPRLRVIRHNGNRGIPTARNTGLAAARGRYLAWLDSDDLARPERLAVQIGWLERHPEVAMLGACAGKRDSSGRRRSGLRVPPFAHDDIAAWLLFRSAFQQSAVTGRTAILREYPYAADHGVCEDVDVFIRLTERHRLANLPRTLIDRRLHDGQTIRCQQTAIPLQMRRLLADSLDRLGVAYGPADLQRHLTLGNRKLGVRDPALLDWAGDWLARLRAANTPSRRYEPAALAFVGGLFLARAWLDAARHAPLSELPRAPGRAFRGLLGPHGRSWLRRAAPVLLRAGAPSAWHGVAGGERVPAYQTVNAFSSSL